MKNLIFFDTETTQKINSRLIQLAYWIDIQGGPINELFFKPAEPICFEAMEVHHITEAQVKDLDPVDPAKLQPLFDGRIAVAHNAPFDIGVMAREKVIINDRIDTLKVAQHLLPDSPAHRLQYLRYSLNLPVNESATAHDAGGDVRVLIELYCYLRNKLMKESQMSEEQAIEKMLELTAKPTIIKKFSFGKYKGQNFADVVKTSAGMDYLRWLNGQPELSEDLKNTLKFYLCSSKS